MPKPDLLRGVARFLAVIAMLCGWSAGERRQCRPAHKLGPRHAVGVRKSSLALLFFALAFGVAPAFADTFYFTRTRALADAENSATGLFLWNDATGAQSQIGGDGSHLSHVTDGPLYVDGIATDLGGTLYGFAMDDASTAGFIPLATGSYCTANMRSRLVSINTSTAEITYVGSWLAGTHIAGAGFDAQGRLWAIDCVTGGVVQISTASGQVVGGPIATGIATIAADLDFAANGMGIIGYGGLQFLTFDPNTGSVAGVAIDAQNSGFDGALVPPYAITGVGFTGNLSARSGSPAADACRLNIFEGRGLDELGHVNDPFFASPAIAYREAEQYNPPNRDPGWYNGGPSDGARAGGPALPNCFFDWGDAPDSYGTLSASNGAYHAVVDTGPYLGSGMADFEVEGQPNATAIGDDSAGTDDEDGVTLPAEFDRGAVAQISLDVGNVGAGTRLQAWIDWAGDGSFAEAGDQILIDQTVVNGVNTFDITSPVNAVAGTTFARFRIANQAGLGAIGPAASGEVEDYQVTISADQPTFGSCMPTMYLGVGAPTQLVSVDTSSNPFTYPPIGDPYSPNYNAMGYDPLSNFIYAPSWDTPTSTYRLLRIGGDGSVRDVGAITGGGINSGSGIASGEVGADGFFYVKHNGTTNQMWRVDLTTRVATLITLDQSFASGDLAWSNGLLYAQDHVTGSFVSVNPTNGDVTPVGPSGFVGPADAFGSMMGASNGVFGRRNSGGFYKFDLTTGQATLISDAPSGGGDGAKCATTPLDFPVDVAVTKDDGSPTYTPGGNIVYTMVVTNNGPFGVQNALVNDSLPADITTASWTCGTQVNGGVCGVASGTGAIIDVPVSLPVGASVTFTLDMSVPPGKEGEIVNIVTVTTPIGSPDANLANNTARDRDVYPLIDTVKTLTGESGLLANVAEPGETLTYTVTVTNAEGFLVQHDLTDNIDDNTTYVGGSAQVDGAPREPDTATDPLVWNDITIGANGTATVTYQVLVADPIPTGVTQIRNAATQDCAAYPQACVDLPTPGTATPSKDLTGETGAVANVAEPGETLTYTVTLTNSGTVGALHDLVDNIDDNTTYVAATASVNGTPREPVGTDPLTWDDVVVPAGGTVDVVYSVLVVDPIPDGVTTIRNAATDDCLAEPDACVTLPTPGSVVPSKDLTAESGVAGNVAEPGETLTYTVTLTNAGSGATLYDLADNIDDNTTYVVGTARVGGTPREPVGTDPLAWDDISVPANGTVDIEYQVLVADPLPDGVTEILNAATNDCTANPQACVLTPTSSSATPSKDLTSESGATADVAEPGETLTYTVTLTNSRAVEAVYDLADNIDDNTTYVAGTATVGGTAREPVGSDPLRWNDVVVPANDSIAVVYQVLVADPLPAGVTQIRNLAYDGTKPEPICEDVPEQCVTVDAPEPRITLEKSGVFQDSNGNGIAEAGETILYSFTVENMGNVPVDEVTPRDAGPSFNGERGMGTLSRFTPDPVATPVTIAPQGVQEFTATYALTQTDIDNGAGVEDGVENTATAVGVAFSTSVTSQQVESEEAVAVLALPTSPSMVSIAKVALLRYVRRGEEAPFAITVINEAGTRVENLTVVDTLPSGFRFVEGSASINGVAVTPVVEGLRVIFENVDVPGNGQIEIRLRMLALSSAGPGEHVNRAHAEDAAGNRLSNEARAVVEILVEPVFDCGDIVGRVFDDENRNGYQDEGELGLPGARVATVDGWLVTTDVHGRFHVPCAALPDQRIGANFIMKLDTRTLPTGYRLTTENPRVVRLTAGKMTELNFGASIGRVVRLDLQDAAFEPGQLELREQWAAGIDELIAFLAVEQSVLRLTYLDPGGDIELAQKRLEHLSNLIGDRWRQTSGQYRLDIETRVETGQ